MKFPGISKGPEDEGELVAVFGQAQLVKHLDGTLELKGGTKEDHLAAREWLSLFWHEAVVRNNDGKPIRRPG